MDLILNVILTPVKLFESERVLTIGSLVNPLVDPYLQTPPSKVHYRGFLMGYFLRPFPFNSADVPLSGRPL